MNNESNTVGLCFPTPVYFGKIAQPALGKVQQDFEETFNALTEKGAFKSPTGWNTHLISDPTFGSNFLEEYQLDEFKKQIDFHVREYLKQIRSIVGERYPVDYKICTSWMTLTKKGNYAHVHDHAYYDIAGAYYFRTTGNDGDLYFNTPLKTVSSSYCFAHMHPSITVKPEVGRIVLFPGWLDHGVTTNTTDSERVSISFNLSFNRKG